MPDHRKSKPFAKREPLPHWVTFSFAYLRVSQFESLKHSSDLKTQLTFPWSLKLIMILSRSAGTKAIAGARNHTETHRHKIQIRSRLTETSGDVSCLIAHYRNETIYRNLLSDTSSLVNPRRI